MGIRVFDRLLPEQQFLGFKIPDDQRVCFSDLESCVLSRFMSEVPRCVDRRQYRQAVPLTYLKILFAMSGSHMDQTGPIGHRNIFRAQEYSVKFPTRLLMGLF